MSKQGELLDLDAVTSWSAVKAALSKRDADIVEYVKQHPGHTAREISKALKIPVNSLNFRLWELAGVSTGPATGDGLLVRSRRRVHAASCAQDLTWGFELVTGACTCGGGHLESWRYYVRGE